MSKSRAFTVSDDLCGLSAEELKNHTAPAPSIKEVQVHIRIYDAVGQEADSAELTVTTLIPPQEPSRAVNTSVCNFRAVSL
jgi:hypothetical protein